MTSGAIPEDVKTKILLDHLRTLELAPNEQARKKAAQQVIKSLRAFGLNEAETKALGDILSQPSEIAKLTTRTLIELAAKNSEALIELQKQWANSWMRQGDSIAGMAGLARTIGTIASLFGATEFADMCNQKADAEMARAEIQYAKARTKMLEDPGTTAVVTRGLREALHVISDRRPGLDVSAATGAATVRGAEVVQADTYDGPEVGSAPAAGRPAAPARRAEQKITWQQFQENMESVGISKTAQEQLKKLYDTTAKFDAVKPDKTVIDSGLEGDKLIKGIQKAEGLTDAQKTQLKQKLHLAAPELVPS